MKKYSVYHIQTEGFQKVLLGMARMIQTVPLDKKCRVVIDYDPALPKAAIETFIDKSDKVDEKADYKFTDKNLESADPNVTDSTGMMRYSMEDSNGCVVIRPMDGAGVITIHGEEEAALFTSCLMDYFQKE